MRKRILVVSLWMALGSLPQAWAQSNVVADSGFRPKPHGFSFENWGGQQYPHAKLTPDDAAFLFGDQACARKQGDSCVPTPGAKMWIDQMNKSTEGGHCEGMAVLSAAFYIKQESVDDFGARQAFELKPNDEWLMRTISTYFTTQALEPVQSVTNATRQWSLQQIVDHLAKTMKSGDDYPTLGIYGDAGGHAITPYKIEQTGAGKYRIYIYDNNYPGAEKFIDVDAGRNQWIYSGAALNPKEDPAAWKGGAGSMDVTLLSTRYEPLKCPFCTAGPAQPKPKPKPKPTPASAPGAKAPGAKAPGAKAPSAKAPGSKPKPKPKPKPQVVAPKPKPAPKPKAPRPAAVPSQGWTVYTPSRCSQVQAVAKSSKQQIKMGANGADSQIDGASMYPMRGTRGCVVQLPKDKEYDVRLVDDGRPSTRPTTDLTVFASGKVYEVSNVAIRPNAAETVSFSPTNFNYQAGGRQKPTIRVADDTRAVGSYYEVGNFEIGEGHNFAAKEDDSGRYAFSNDDPDLDTFDVDVEVVGEDDTEYYEFEDINTGDDGQVLFDVGDDGEFDMDVDSDGDGDGNYYDEDDDNDGSDDADDADDDNDGVGDDDDNDYVGEDYDDGGDEVADDEADEGADDGSDEGADEGADDGSDEGADEGADDGSDEVDDAVADDESDEGADDEFDGGDKSALIDNDSDDESGDAEDEGSVDQTDAGDADDEADGETGDEAGYAAEDEGEDSEADHEDESASEDESTAADEAAYEDESAAEDESAYEEEAGEAEAAYEDESGEDESAYEDESSDADEGTYEDE